MTRYTLTILTAAAALWAGAGSSLAQKDPPAAPAAKAKAAAGKQPGPGEAKVLDPNDPKQVKAAMAEAAQKAYSAGAKAFETGKHKDAVPLLSQALAGGGLPSQQMAKALYYRGVANRKLGKPAQAMSDLTTSLWVSGGLSDADRAAAVQNRQAAYREAGLGDNAPDVVPGPVATPPKPAPAPPAAAAPEPAAPAIAVAAPPQPAPPSEPVAVAVVAPPAAQPAPPAASWPAEMPPTAAASAPVPPKPAAVESSGIPSPFGEPPASTARSQSAPAPVMAVPDPEPVPSGPAEPSMLEKAGDSVAEAGSNVTKFFGNMFGGGSSSTSTPPAPASVATATAPPPPVEAQTSASGVMTATNPDGAVGSDWGDTTQVKSAGKPTKVAMAAPPAASPVSTGAIGPAAAAPARKALTGKYVLQIGAVRTRAEADQLAQKVKSNHGAALGGREPAIDEAVIGNFGNFHRVRIAPYADAKEPGRLCGTLMKAGFDCLVVTQ